MGERRPFSYALLTLIVVIGIVVAAISGGVVGGVAGYTAARRRQPQQVVREVERVIEATPEVAWQITELTLKESSAVIEATAKVRPAVVTVINTLEPQRGFLGEIREPKATGSGVIVDRSGYIITNNHVIANFTRLDVIYADGGKAQAKLVGADPLVDLAVIKVEAPVPAVAEWGDSSILHPGQKVIAIGSALGNFQSTVTSGVISAVDRRLDTGMGYALEGLIQTDAAINQGNSGGPLINTLGQVVGINTIAVRGDLSGPQAEGLGFAIASNTAREIAEELIKRGRVERPYLGIRYQVITPQIASAYELPVQHGVAVFSVEPASPVERAGLEVGDIITAIGDQKIDEKHYLANILMKHKVGEEVTLSVLREGRELTLEVELGARPE